MIFSNGMKFVKCYGVDGSVWKEKSIPFVSCAGNESQPGIKTVSIFIEHLYSTYKIKKIYVFDRIYITLNENIEEYNQHIVCIFEEEDT